MKKLVISLDYSVGGGNKVFKEDFKLKGVVHEEITDYIRETFEENFNNKYNLLELDGFELRVDIKDVIKYSEDMTLIDKRNYTEKLYDFSFAENGYFIRYENEDYLLLDTGQYHGNIYDDLKEFLK